MSFEIKIADTDIAITANENETILAALNRAGFEVPYSCNKGVCGSCQGKIISGTCNPMSAGEGISQEELNNGQALFCTAIPNSNLVIKPSRIKNREVQEVKKYSLKLSKITKVARDVTVLQMRMPIGQRAKFKAGQYLEVTLPDGQKRNYSMANIPSADAIELHVREVPGGKFSSEMMPTLKTGDVLDIEFPKGEFYIRADESTSKPKILLASGTGYAPIQSIIQALAKSNSLNDVTCYWGGRTKQDLYALDKINALIEKHPQLKFIPVLSEPIAEDDWRGRTGFVHQAVMEDFPNLSEYEVYACGSPLMVNAARADFQSKCGLQLINFYSDAFA